METAKVGRSSAEALTTLTEAPAVSPLSLKEIGDLYRVALAWTDDRERAWNMVLAYLRGANESHQTEGSTK